MLAREISTLILGSAGEGPQPCDQVQRYRIIPARTRHQTTPIGCEYHSIEASRNPANTYFKPSWTADIQPDGITTNCLRFLQPSIPRSHHGATARTNTSKIPSIYTLIANISFAQILDYFLLGRSCKQSLAKISPRCAFAFTTLPFIRASLFSFYSIPAMLMYYALYQAPRNIEYHAMPWRMSRTLTTLLFS